MLSANRIKYIRSLHQKKYRQKYSQFLVEGLKTTQEFINQNWLIDSILVQEGHKMDIGLSKSYPLEEVSSKQMGQISTLKTAPSVLAVVKMKERIDLDSSFSFIALDNINDPGNLGTIIRIADWYGINQVLVSENTVDEYNSKVVSSTMGSLARVNIVRSSLMNSLKSFQGVTYAALLEGESIQSISKPIAPFCLLIGSESHGISNEILSNLNMQHVTIPNHGGAESLNAGVATGILIDRLING